MKKEDKLTTQRVFDDVMAIIKPKATNGNNRGAALVQAMLSRAQAATPAVKPAPSIPNIG